MIDKQQHDRALDRCQSVIFHIHHFLLNKNNQHFDKGDEVKNLLSYFEGADRKIELSKDKRKLNFTVGDYDFFIETKVNTIHGMSWGVVRTFETVKDSYRIAPKTEPIILHIPSLDIALGNHGDFKMNPKEYATKLIEYIASIEAITV